MGNLWMKVKISGGTNKESAVTQLCDLAKKLGINIESTLNGRIVLATPKSQVSEILAELEKK